MVHRGSIVIAALCLAACDGSLGYTGSVVNASTREPVAKASVYLADVVMNRPMRDFLAGKATALQDSFPNETAEDGTFSVGERIAGGGSHRVWLVVLANGYAPYKKLVWADWGFPQPSDRLITVELYPH